MSGTLSITTPAVPSITDSAVAALASMAALAGTATDYNSGSNIRALTLSEGAVIEQQGVAVQATVLQGMVYGAMQPFNILPNGQVASTGLVTFATSPSGSPTIPAPINIGISENTIVGTAGGVSFAVATSGAVIASGASSTTVPVVCTVGGTVGNVASGTINTILGGVGYPLYVYNANPTGGGAAAETPSQTIARLSAKLATFGLSSPVAVANACIGVSNGSGEVVRYANCYEPWLEAGSGVGSGTAGFTLYIDNGTGSASSSLVSAVTAYILNGNNTGFRPAGVPFSVVAGTPIIADVVVSGTLFPGLVNAQVIAAGTTSGIAAYFDNLNFNGLVEQSQIAAVAANAALGFYSALSVTLSSSGGTVSTIASTASGRVVLNSLTVDVS